jgi:tripartite-type tricarboxylate transporter receptor subunit TctC
MKSRSSRSTPKNTPAEIIDKLNNEISAGLADSRIKARLSNLGVAVLAGAPADFEKFIADETEKWARVVKFSGANRTDRGVGWGQFGPPRAMTSRRRMELAI